MIRIHFASFSQPRKLVVFHWSLRNSKSSQVSRTLSIHVNLDNAVVWMVWICLSISDSFSPLSKLLRTVPSAPITIGIIVTTAFLVLWQGLSTYIYIYIYIYEVHTISFKTYFRKGTFIDSTCMKLNSPSKESPPAAMHLSYRYKNFWKAPWKSSCVSVSMTFVTASFISSIVS